MEKPIMNMPRMVSLDQYLRQLSTLLCTKYVSVLWFSVVLSMICLCFRVALRLLCLEFRVALSLFLFCLGFRVSLYVCFSLLRVLGLSFFVTGTSPACLACAAFVCPREGWKPCAHAFAHRRTRLRTCIRNHAHTHSSMDVRQPLTERSPIVRSWFVPVCWLTCDGGLGGGGRKCAIDVLDILCGSCRLIRDTGISWDGTCMG